jgi:hypothetical protein
VEPEFISIHLHINEEIRACLKRVNNSQIQIHCAEEQDLLTKPLS